MMTDDMTEKESDFYFESQPILVLLLEIFI